MERYVTLYRSSDQNHPKEKEMQEGKVVVWRGFARSWGKKWSKKQGRMRKIYPTYCRVPKNSKSSSAINTKIVENNRMGKTRDLFKKIGDIKGIFHARIGMKNARNSKDLTEAEESKKRWQECTEELYRRGLHDPDNHNGVVTHQELDILEGEVK